MSKSHLDNLNLYEVLGVERDATNIEIKTAYKQLALKYHPDKNSSADAQTKFQQISFAYAVLSDPVKKQSYDISGSSDSFKEGFDVTEMSGIARVFGALFSKLGVSIPTQINPKVLAEANAICNGQPHNAAVYDLHPNQSYNLMVSKQCGVYFRHTVPSARENKSSVLIVHSSGGSKFKLLVFDQHGDVRFVQESRKVKSGTQADLFFTNAPMATLLEFNPLMHELEKKGHPHVFGYLNGLSSQRLGCLEPRDHYFCVYGDNFLSSTKFKIYLYVIREEINYMVERIVAIEKQLFLKKDAVAEVEKEYLAAKAVFEEATRKVKAEDTNVLKMISEREKLYEAMFSTLENSSTD